MTISKTEVGQIARLARLELSPAELESMTRDLSSILEHVRELEAVDTEGVPAVGGVSEHPAPMRADEVGADPLGIPLAELAPAFDQNFFTVPRLAALDADALDGGSA